MYSLKVIKGFTHPDGRIFEPGHDCSALDPFEVSELIYQFPDNFEPANGETVEFLKNTENVEKLARSKIERAEKAQAEADEHALKELQAKIKARKS